MDLFSGIVLVEESGSKSNSSGIHTLKGGKAIRNVERLERILVDPASAILRNRIIEIAGKCDLVRDRLDRSDVHFRLLTSIPGNRKMKDYKIFPQSIVNNMDDDDNVQSFFFRHEPHSIEVVKTGTQPCQSGTQKIPFVLYRLSPFKHINMGLFHLRTIGLSFKALGRQLSPSELRKFPFYESISNVMGRKLEFRCEELLPDEADVVPTNQRIALAGTFDMHKQGSTLGTVKETFGFFSQRIKAFAEHPAIDGHSNCCAPVRIRYDHNRNGNKSFIVWSDRTDSRNDLCVNDIFLTIDTLWKERNSDDMEDDSNDSNNNSVLPNYEQAINESITYRGRIPFENMPPKDRQKIIVDLGESRYLLTSMEILEAMVNNHPQAENPIFELPQRDKSFSDWLREQQRKLFPDRNPIPQADLVLPTM
jgi:hypothetical protein